MFNSYVCVGDTSTKEFPGGWEIEARLEFDDMTRPSDYDCYDDKEIERWNNDEWWYCGIVLSVYKNGIMLNKHAASLWGVEANIVDNNEYLNDMFLELCDEALDKGKETLKTLMEESE
jgi:hypothetical protein